MTVDFDPIGFTHIPNRDSVSPSRLQSTLKFGDVNLCKVCGARTEYSLNHAKGAPPFRKTCSDACFRSAIKAANIESAPKRKATFMARYGVDSALKVSKFKNKRRATLKERYGSADWSPMSIPGVKEKAISANRNKSAEQQAAALAKRTATCMDLYGVTNGGGSEAAVEKIKKTNRKHWGHDWYFQSAEFIEKAKAANAYPANRYQKPKLDLIEKLAAEGLSCKAMEKGYGLDHDSTAAYLKSIGKYKQYNVSYPEKVLKDALDAAGCTGYIMHDRQLLKPKELDFYFSDKKIAVEINGLFWHSERVKPNDKLNIYHKWLEGKQAGIRILEFSGSEILGRTEQVVQFIRHQLLPSDRVEYARNCKVVDVDTDTAVEFVNKYHLQSVASNKQITVGLMIDDELLSVMMFSRHHRQGHSDITIQRMCSIYGCVVVGGATRMLKHAMIKNGWDRVITWSNNQYTDGAVYAAMGMKKDAELPPDYMYYRLSGDGHAVSKQSCTRAKLKCAPGETELEKATSLGMIRVWDCGKIRWVFEA